MRKAMLVLVCVLAGCASQPEPGSWAEFGYLLLIGAGGAGAPSDYQTEPLRCVDEVVSGRVYTRCY